jgi:hypothetical protein
MFPSPFDVAAAVDGALIVQLAHDDVTVGLFDDGSVRKISNASPTPMPVSLSDATFVAGPSGLGFHGDCAILRTGGTACSGFVNGFVPVPETSGLLAVGITEYGHACGLNAAGVVTCWNIQQHPEWGDAADGNTVLVPLGQPATAIGAGDDNGCALLADGTVKCWAIDGTYTPSLGGSVATSAGWPSVDLGSRPTP